MLSSFVCEQRSRYTASSNAIARICAEYLTVHFPCSNGSNRERHIYKNKSNKKKIERNVFRLNN